MYFKHFIQPLISFWVANKDSIMQAVATQKLRLQNPTEPMQRPCSSSAAWGSARHRADHWSPSPDSFPLAKDSAYHRSFVLWPLQSKALEQFRSVLCCTLPSAFGLELGKCRSKTIRRNSPPQPWKCPCMGPTRRPNGHTELWNAHSKQVANVFPQKVTLGNILLTLPLIC